MENEDFQVTVTSPDPTAMVVTAQTHYPTSSQQQHIPPNQFDAPHFPLRYPPFGMNRFNGPFSSSMEQPYGVGYSFQSHINVPLFENQTQGTACVPKKKGKNPSSSQSSNPPRRLWTTAEDIALTKAYLYVSVDSIVGKDQTSERMWNRILVAWRENMGTYDDTRKANGLSCRWGLIQAVVTNFHGAYEHLERAPQRGASIMDVKRKALRVYKETGDGSAFKFEHCWEILKENPKWCSLQLTKTGNSKKEKKTVASMVDTLPAFSQTASTSFGVTDVEKESSEAEKGVARPPGKNTSKDRIQKMHEQKNMVVLPSSFQSTIEKQHLLNQQELELKKERDRKDHEMMEQLMKKELEFKEKAQQLKEAAQRQKDKRGKRKECERIMTTDLTILQPSIRKVYEKMQANIIKEWEEEGLLGDDWHML